MIGGTTLSDTDWGKAKLKIKEVKGLRHHTLQTTMNCTYYTGIVIIYTERHTIDDGVSWRASFCSQGAAKVH